MIPLEAADAHFGIDGKKVVVHKNMARIGDYFSDATCL